MQKIFWFGFKCFKSKEITSHLFFRIGPFNFNFYNSCGFTSLTPFEHQDLHPLIWRHNIELCIISTLIAVLCRAWCRKGGWRKHRCAMHFCSGQAVSSTSSGLQAFVFYSYASLALSLVGPHLVSHSLIGKGTYQCVFALLLTENSI